MHQTKAVLRFFLGPQNKFFVDQPTRSSPAARSSCSRPPLHHHHHHPTSNQAMKLFPSYFAVLSVVAVSQTRFSQAWVSHSSAQTRSPLLFRTTATATARRLSTSVVPVEPARSGSGSQQQSATTKEKAIAEGVIVSQFPGGLTALRINEDLADDEDDPTPVAVGLLGTKSAARSSSKNSAASGDFQGNKVVFPDGTEAVVVAHRPPLVFCFSDHPKAEQLQDGLVKILKSKTSLKVSPSVHAVDCFGKPLRNGDNDESSAEAGDGAPDDSLNERAIFSPTPGVADIALINTCMLTGTTMIDTLAPIGRGQNMLLIGEDSSQMRGLSLDFIRTQNRLGHTKCVYASTDTDPDEAWRRVQDAGLADDIHFVGRPRDSKSDGDDMSRAAAAVTTASTACAIAESYALQKGLHTLVVIDNIDLHKVFWDATTRVLVDVFGIDAVVESDRSGGASSEMRGFFSSLIQRAGQYKEKRGGGSVTLLLIATLPSSKTDVDTVFEQSEFEQMPDVVKTRIQLLTQKKIPLTATNLLKIGIPVPSASEGQRRLVLQHIDDLMSMSDGQIWLDERLQAKGQQPPVDPQRSITRVGIGADTQSRADAPALRSIAEGLRLDLSQAMSLDGAEATTASEKQRKRQKALLLAMYQTAGSGGRRLAESCCALLAAKEGYLDEAVDAGALAGTEKGDQLMRNLLDHTTSVAAESMDAIDESLSISVKARAELKEAIVSFFHQR